MFSNVKNMALLLFAKNVLKPKGLLLVVVLSMH